MLDELVKYGNFQSVGKNQNKKQIILTNTSRNVKDYLQSLKYRYNGKYDKIPNYIVTREGKILQLLDNDEYGKYNGNDKVDLAHATIKILRDGVINPNFDCILPASDIIALPYDIKPGISGITYATNNTEPEIVSFYEFQINRKIFM